jgi:glycosyltransferase involved in cell wall biosynthesis
MKLAIVTTHPIQYNAPWFKLMARTGKTELTVFYTWSQAAKGAKYDPDFGREIEWDIPLLEGYDFRFVENTSADPGTHHFKGIVNPGLVKEITAWGPDAVLVFGWSFHSHLQCLRHFHGRIPVLFRGDSTLLDEMPGIKRSLRRIFLKWVYRFVDHALYVGENNRDYFLRHGLKAQQLTFAPHAIDNDRFAAAEAERSREALAWRKELGIRPDDLVVLFAGKLEPKKNPFFLLELAQSIDDARLKIVVVGNGVLEEQLKKAASADPRFLFLDFKNQQRMPVVYRVCDLFILPSAGPGETWGLSVNEAMACGKPVMVSDKAGCAIDLVRSGSNGLIVDIHTIDPAVRFISDILHNRDRLLTLNENSRQIIRIYSFTAILHSLEGLLSKIKTTNVREKL